MIGRPWLGACGQAIREETSSASGRIPPEPVKLIVSATWHESARALRPMVSGDRGYQSNVAVRINGRGSMVRSLCGVPTGKAPIACRKGTTGATLAGGEVAKWAIACRKTRIPGRGAIPVTSSDSQWRPTEVSLVGPRKGESLFGAVRRARVGSRAPHSYRVSG